MKEKLTTEELKKQAIECLKQRGKKIPCLKVKGCIEHIKEYKAENDVR